MAGIANTYGADGGRPMKKGTDESGEEQPGVYWVYWVLAEDMEKDPYGDWVTWRANFLTHESYMSFVMKDETDAVTIVDQGWYETH